MFQISRPVPATSKPVKQFIELFSGIWIKSIYPTSGPPENRAAKVDNIIETEKNYLSIGTNRSSVAGNS